MLNIDLVADLADKENQFWKTHIDQNLVNFEYCDNVYDISETNKFVVYGYGFKFSNKDDNNDIISLFNMLKKNLSNLLVQFSEKTYVRRYPEFEIEKYNSEEDAYKVFVTTRLYIDKEIFPALPIKEETFPVAYIN